MEISLGSLGLGATRQSVAFPAWLVALIGGQSQNSGRLTNNQTYTPAGAGAQMFGNDYVLKTLADPVDGNAGQVDTVSSDAATGSIWPLVASRLLAANGAKPLIFIPCAKGGTRISEWLPGADHENRSTLYGSMIHRARQVGGVNINLFQIGTSDAIAGTTKATFKSQFSSFAAAVYADLGIPTMLAKFNKPADATALAGSPAIWEAIGELWAEDPNVIEGPDLSGVISDDSYHYTTDLKGSWEADQWLPKIQAFLGQAQTLRGPSDYPYELDASDHWVFGGSSDSLVGKIAGGSLSLAGSAPTYNANSLVLASGGRNGLLSPYDDSLNKSWWMICRRPAQDVTAVFGGALGAGANPGGGNYNTGGTLIYARGDTTPDRMEATTRTSTTFPGNNIAWPAGLNPDGWFFLGVREVTTAGTTTREIYIHGSGWVTASGVKVLPSPMRKHAFGNAYYVVAGYYNGLEVAQVGEFNRDVTRAQIEAVAARQAVIEAGRGHSLFGA